MFNIYVYIIIYIYNHVVLASLQGDYHIHLKPEATPFALPPPLQCTSIDATGSES